MDADSARARIVRIRVRFIEVLKFDSKLDNVDYNSSSKYIIIVSNGFDCNICDPSGGFLFQYDSRLIPDLTVFS